MKKLSLEELNRLSPEEYRKVSPVPVVVVLDNIRSGLNVGSLFRTADAFRIEKIFCLGITAKPPHREILKTALGATDTVPWEGMEDGAELISSLKAEGYTILAVEQAEQSVPLNEFEPDKNRKYAVVLGNEVGGVSDDIMELADTALEIPQFGTKHSLNVAVCGGIVLWHLAGVWLGNEV
ncbi:MAG: TrmH family RNA methyltransferase [Saprospirales bacterium]|nr:MAG: TrmH family RNA methyltransferase [Saprospirales bacterium]